METMKFTHVSVRFADEEKQLFEKLVRKQVGERNVNYMLDNYGFCFDWYKRLLSVLGKIYSGIYCGFESTEFSVIVDIVNPAYNDPTTDEHDKEIAKRMLDQIDELQRRV